MTIMERIENELQLLGITRRYLGYRQTALAVELAIEDESRLHNITGRIYSVIGERCACKEGCIERNIRTASQVAWKTNRPRLRRIAGYPLYAPPSASEFIAILVSHLQRSQELSAP